MILALAAALAAQDFATDWLDRVTHETMLAHGPLDPRATAQLYHLGALAYYDSNAGLSEDDEEEQFVLVPFLRVRLDHATRQVDAALDAALSYKWYRPDSEFSDDEERVYGRIRFVAPGLALELAEIFRHESDPVDAVFADRAPRYVSNTVGRAAWEATKVVGVEANVDFGLVRMEEDEFDRLDNHTLRADLGLLGRLGSGLDAVAQAGYLLIDYRRSSAAPDTDGVYARGGLRGELNPALVVTALAGVVRAESEDFDSGAEGEEDEALELVLNLRYEWMDRLTLIGDLTRTLGFAGGIEPFAINNRFLARADYEVSEEWTLQGRVQYELLEGVLGIDRTWLSVSAGFEWRAHPQVIFDAGASWRRGDTDGAGFDSEFDQTVLHVGLIATN